MFGKFFAKLIGSRNDRYLKKLKKTVDLINSLEPAFVALSDEELKLKTAEFKQRILEMDPEARMEIIYRAVVNYRKTLSIK